jgi:hypothetical protein
MPSPSTERGQGGGDEEEKSLSGLVMCDQEGGEGSMQRYILRRFLHSLLAIWVLSMIVFSLARVTGNPLDVLLPLEAGPEEYERVAKHWGLDKPLYTQ